MILYYLCGMRAWCRLPPSERGRCRYISSSFVYGQVPSASGRREFLAIGRPSAMRLWHNIRDGALQNPRGTRRNDGWHKEGSAYGHRGNHGKSTF